MYHCQHVFQSESELLYTAITSTYYFYHHYYISRES